MHQLNASASLVWTGLNEGLSVNEMAARLAATFDVEKNTAVADIETTIAQFEELALLTE